MKHLVRGCSLDAESGGLVIEYLTPADDIRTNGMVLNHALLIPPEDAFIALIEEVEETLQRALTGALALFEAAPGVGEREDPDEPSPYDNPAER